MKNYLCRKKGRQWFCLIVANFLIIAPMFSVVSPIHAQDEAPLTGKKIVVNPGHGLYWTGSAWTTQRDEVFGVVEDFLTIEFATYLTDLLTTQGATVYVTRELDKNAGTGESGSPKWQEASRYYFKSLGLDESIWNNNSSDDERAQDINSRPLYANSLNADILVGIHTNGGGGTGTETLYDSLKGQPALSKQLADSLHSKVIDFGQKYNSSWRDRGVKPEPNTKGELRLAEMPTALVEIAFHDTQFPDNEALQDRAFQKSIAIAMCNGILEYFGKSGSCEKPILIDQGHNNWYSLDRSDDWSYQGFAEALHSNAMETMTLDNAPVTLEELENYAAYVIPLAMDEPTTAEIEAMQTYVENGGALFIIADWGGVFSDPSQALANVFGISLDANIVVDVNHDIDMHDEYGTCDCWIRYDAANFSSHTIMDGLNSLQTYATTGMLPGTASPLIRTNTDATPADRAIAVALNYGAGRVVIVGDSNYFDDENPNYPIRPIGLAQNRQFAINIVNWITQRAPAQPTAANVAFFDDGSDSTDKWEAGTTWGLEETVLAAAVDASFAEFVWSDSPGTTYENDLDSALTSIDIDLSTFANPLLSFITKFELEARADYGYVEVSVDNGTIWTNVATFTGSSTEWSTEQVGMSKLAGVGQAKLRFRLVTNETVTMDGWYVDNIKVFEGPVVLNNTIFLPAIFQASEGSSRENMSVTSDIRGNNPAYDPFGMNLR